MKANAKHAFLMIIIAGIYTGIAQSKKPISLVNPLLSISIDTKEPSVKAGSPIRVHIVLANVSSQNVGLSLVPGVFPYEVDVRYSNGLLVPETDHGRKMRAQQNGYTSAEYTLVLKPDERQEVDCTVGEWNDLSKPGIYVIQMQREDHPGTKSNKMTVTVTQ